MERENPRNHKFDRRLDDPGQRAERRRDRLCGKIQADSKVCGGEIEDWEEREGCAEA
jgi:hypothetical protein